MCWLKVIYLCSFLAISVNTFNVYKHTNFDDYNTQEHANTTILSRTNSRQKRQAVIAWTPSSVFIADFFINIQLPTPRAVSSPFTFQMRNEFDLPTIPLSFGRNLRERYNMYSYLEGFLSHFNINGKQCILRAICEKAEYDVVNHGIISELASFILELETTPQHIDLVEYHKAKDIGKHEGHCLEMFQDCPFSLFHLFE